MKTELLFFDGCPSYEALLPRLREIVAAHGAELELRRVESLEAAQAERFLGSPTVRVNGRDIEPGAEGRDDFGLKCRLYATTDAYSPVPPLEWLVDALEAAARG